MEGEIGKGRIELFRSPGGGGGEGGTGRETSSTPPAKTLPVLGNGALLRQGRQLVRRLHTSQGTKSGDFLWGSGVGQGDRETGTVPPPVVFSAIGDSLGRGDGAVRGTILLVCIGVSSI